MQNIGGLCPVPCHPLGYLPLIPAGSLGSAQPVQRSQECQIFSSISLSTDLQLPRLSLCTLPLFAHVQSLQRLSWFPYQYSLWTGQCCDICFTSWPLRELTLISERSVRSVRWSRTEREECKRGMWCGHFCKMSWMSWLMTWPLSYKIQPLY